MKLKKVAIVKDGKDVGRIIPFNLNEGDSDFKISFIKNDYKINLYRFISSDAKEFEVEDMNKWEISYHRKTSFKPAIIHIKEKKNNAEYRPLPLYRLVDPTIYNEFPIPFMRIEIPMDFEGRDYKTKAKEHILFDIGDSNVAELYLTNSDFNYGEFSQKWPTLSLKLLAHSFEFFATNNMITDKYKIKYFNPSNIESTTAAKEFTVNDDMKFYINIYKNPEYRGGKIRVTFIENEFAEALLVLSLVGYENSLGKVEMNTAFKEDLRRDTMTFKEKSKWRYKFNKMQIKLEKEIKKQKEKKVFRL